MPACGNCGYTSIDDSAVYCPRCGEALGAAVDAGAEEVRPSIDQKESSKEIMPEKRELIPNAGYEPIADQTQTTPHAPPPSAAPKIGGWLYIPAIHMFWAMSSELFTPLAFIFIVAANFVGQFIGPGFGLSFGYGFTAFSFFASFSFTILAIRWVYVCIWFFKKRVNAPKALADQFLASSVNYLVSGVWLLFIIASLDVKDKDYFEFAYGLGYAVFAFIMSMVYRRAFSGSKRAKATFINPIPVRHFEAGKLGGWLYIIAVYLAMQSVYAIYELIDLPEFIYFLKLISLPWNNRFIIAYFELLFILTVVIGFLVAGIMFILKKSKFPIIFIFLLFSISAKNILLPVCEAIFFNLSLVYTFENVRKATFFLCAAIVCTIAFRRSKRAKATFVN